MPFDASWHGEKSSRASKDGLPPFSGGPRSVDTQVLTLRRKLEQAGLGEGGGITTVRQQGYRFSIDNI